MGQQRVADRLLQTRACHLLLELELAQPFDKALVLDLVVAILKLHHQLVLLQTTQRIFRCIQRSRHAQTQLLPQTVYGQAASECRSLPTDPACFLAWLVKASTLRTSWHCEYQSMPT